MKKTKRSATNNYNHGHINCGSFCLGFLIAPCAFAIILKSKTEKNAGYSKKPGELQQEIQIKGR